MHTVDPDHPPLINNRPARKMPMPIPLALAACMACVLPITPARANDNGHDRCQIQLSNVAVDFGATTRAELLARQISPLAMDAGKQSVTLTATCKEPVLMTLFFHGAAVDATSYALGSGGAFTLTASDAHLDGRAVGLGAIQVHGQVPEVKADQIALAPGVGVVPISNNLPLKGSSLSLRIEINATVSNLGSRVTDRTRFLGAGNFELLED